ncbi:MAG TPA: hypothetical protein VFY15_01195 [Acidimicrobiia bacterium]|nr:hypothetical protein [Acidimicrobiia bacterium]
MSSSLKAMIAIGVAIAIGVGVVLALTGGDDEGSAATTSTSTGVVSTTDGSGSPVTAPTTTAAAASCGLEGTWRLQDQTFFDAVMALSPGEGEFEYVSGDYFVEFRGGGEFVETRNTWRFRVTSPDGVIEVETDGETPGTWTASAEGFEILGSEGNLTASMWILEGGTLVPLPVGGAAMGIPGVVGVGTYDCADGALVLHIAADDGPFTVTFDRQG